MWSVTSAIRSQFSIGQQNSAAFSAQQGAAAKMSMSRGAEGTMDEVYYAGLNDADTDYDIDIYNVKVTMGGIDITSLVCSQE